MILLGVGAGIAFNPVLLAAMSDVEPEQSGLASGVVNTSFMMGGALGLAVLVSLSTSRTNALAAAGDSALVALNGGFQLAFAAGACSPRSPPWSAGCSCDPSPWRCPKTSYPTRSPAPTPRDLAVGGWGWSARFPVVEQ